MKDNNTSTPLIHTAVGAIKDGKLKEAFRPRNSYLVVAPDRPTAEEYARGAKLIPSMLEEGVNVWRVPEA